MQGLGASQHLNSDTLRRQRFHDFPNDRDQSPEI